MLLHAIVLAGALSSDQVRAAIADEKGRACYPLKQGMSAWSPGGPEVACLTTPYSRIVGMAQAAKRKYKPFTEADVPEAALRPEFEVIAYAEAKLEVEAVVLAPRKGKGADGVIQPTSSSEVSAEFQNLYGAKFDGKGMVATFPLELLTEAHEIRIVRGGKEWKIGINPEKLK